MTPITTSFAKNCCSQHAVTRLLFVALQLAVVQAQVAPRWGQAATVLGSRLYVHGGKIDQDNAYSYTSAPNTNELLTLDFTSSFSLDDPPWVIVDAPDGPSLAFHTITPYSNNQFLIFGGDPGPDVALSTRNDSSWTLELDGDAGSWTGRAEGWALQPMRRKYHSAVCYHDRVYITGGEKVDDSDFGFIEQYAFEPSTPNFGLLPTTESAPPDLVGHSSIVLSDGRLVLLGGLIRSSGQLQSLDTAYVYNTQRHSWSRLELSGDTIPDARRGFAATLLENDRILIHGGADASLQSVFSDAAILDVESRSWSALPALSETLGARFDHTAVGLGSRVFFIFGHNGNEPLDANFQLFDFGTNSFVTSYTPTPNSPTTPNTNAPPGSDPGSGGNNGGNNGGSGNNGNGNTGSGNGGGSGNDGSGGTGDDSNGSNGEESPSGNGGSKKPNLPAIILGTIFGTLALAATAGVVFIFVIKPRRQNAHRRGWSQSSDDAEKVIMVGGFGPQGRRGGSIMTRLMNVGRPVHTEPQRERFDILAEEDNVDWNAMGVGRYRDRSGSSYNTRPGMHTRQPSGLLGSMINASVTSFRSTFGLAGTGGTALTSRTKPVGPDEHGVVDPVNPFLDTYATAALPRRLSKRESSLNSHRESLYNDPFADGNHIPENEYERAMSLQNLGMRRSYTDGSTSSAGNPTGYTIGGGNYVPLAPINSINSDPSSQAHTSTSEGPALTSGLTVSSPSHENFLDSARSYRGVIHLGNPPNQPTSAGVYRSTSAGSRLGAGLTRTITAISSMFSSDAGHGYGHRQSGAHHYDDDFRDPRPAPPHLGAIAEAKWNEEKSSAGPEDNNAGASDPKKLNKGRVNQLLIAPAHGRSLSSLRTANTEALENLGGGKWEVVQRVNTEPSDYEESFDDIGGSGGVGDAGWRRRPIWNRTQSSTSSSMPERRPSSLGIMVDNDDEEGSPFVDSPAQVVPQPWKALRLKTPDSPSASPVERNVLIGPRAPPTPKKVIGEGLAARINALQKKASVDLTTNTSISSHTAIGATDPPSSPTKSKAKITYGLAPKPTLFIANPERRNSSAS